MTWFFICFLVLQSVFCNAEMQKENEIFRYSGSDGSMVKLLKLENKLKKNLEVIGKDLQDKLNMIKLYQTMLEHIPLTGLKKQEEYVANPLNAFALLRRLQQDWPKWLAYLGHQTKMEKMQKHLKLVPSEKDLQTAVEGLLRIESVYNLETSHMAKGLLLDTQYNSYLTTPDCIALAERLFNDTEYARSSHWYRTAMRLYRQPYDTLFSRVLGLKRKKLNRLYAQAIVNEPDNTKTPPADGIDPSWQELAEKMTKNAIRESSSDKITHMVDKYLAVDEKIYINLRAKYKPRPKAMERACRGLWPERKTDHLSCRYVYENSAYLKLAPMKLEQLSLEPVVQLYHDVLYDSEIKAIKNMSVPEAKAKRVELNINQRVADMTGYGMMEHNKLHVLNFALGQGADTKSCKARADRIATIVFYANDVAIGGATIFPKLRLLVQPRRGTALLWYNLNADGAADPLAKHAVCPVVLGSRWAITKCMEQEQRRPSKKLCLA
ncbi:prolyl 4-hydroxylase subunit alpha-1 [Drosophila mojavensis]|uniref:Prolyl 4-hydroxylase alpha subunit domain-containing protein n=1 Tax=Drosophila mojavensis TaxID=7230 RepID=B4L0D2_DROMO|nr:prolyl 4-hydroxylase subunit alpha-1 [Drosophila mojavensis]EDW19101.2 uncharacterized protein Dmoj_GI13597 [Drosophila mojavensis]